MQVSDLVNQYHNTLNSGSKIATKTKGVEQLSKTVASLEKGQIFEGTVKSVKGDKVTLALSSGQTVTAKLDKGISLGEGQSVFFQVKSNEGGTVQIRPVSSEFGGNPTLLAALKGAGLPENETNLKLVNAMMKEQMPIDKASIQDMIRTLRGNPGADIDTLVSMKKLDIPINEGMITQFENYKESEGAILKMVGELADDIPGAFSGSGVSKSDVLNFTNDLLNIVSDGKTIGEPFGTASQTINSTQTTQPFVPMVITSEGVVITNPSLAPDGNTVLDENGNPVLKKDGTPVTAGEVRPVSENLTGEGPVTLNIGEAAHNPESGTNVSITGNPETAENVTRQGEVQLIQNREYPKDSLGAILSPENKQEFTRLLNSLPEIRQAMPELFDVFGRLNEETKGSDVLRAVNQAFNANPNLSKEDLLSFLDKPPVKELINNVLGNAWTIEPKELTKKGAVDKLYEKIEEDMEKIINSSRQSSHEANNPIANTAQGVKDNLSFIREVNQLYQYVQIPLQMSGEKTTGELYVYSNKKQKRAENDEITAFLHFDMEHLGSTDIAVKLQGKTLDTKFFLEDDISFQIVEKHLPVLEERLRDLGYNCTLTAENDKREVNFVEDFLKQDVKTAGDIRRYSFDVRA